MPKFCKVDPFVVFWQDAFLRNYMAGKSLSIQAIELTRAVFESIHGNLGILKFNIAELTPTNGTNGENSKKWRVICSFYETLGSTEPASYQVDVNLNDNTVAIKKISIDSPGVAQTYRVTSAEQSDSGT